MDVDLAKAIWGPTLTGLAILFGLWAAWGLSRRQRAGRRVTKRIYHCTVCNRTYLDDHRLPSRSCPRCGTMVDAWIEG